ncbi:MAG: hypothetical protein AAGJ93_08205, partial [Bacteroidota bacterium]
VATTFNYYPEIAPYQAFSSFSTAEEDDLILTFFRENSGTFIIEEGATLLVNKTESRQIPSQLMGVGASLQVFSPNGLFQDLSLTKLSFSKSIYRDEYFITNPAGDTQYIVDGYEERTAAFAMRYEVGKFFGKKRRRGDILRFGLAGSLEPSFYTYRRTPLGPANFPLNARVFTLELSVVPVVSAQLSKKLSLDFKLIPNVLFADYGYFKIENPILTEEQKKVDVEYDLPEVNLAFSVLLRYQIQEYKKRRTRVGG